MNTNFLRCAFKKLFFVWILLLATGCSLSSSISSTIDSIFTSDSFRVVPPSADITEGGVLALNGENGEPPYVFEKVSGAGVVSAEGSFSAVSSVASPTVTVKATDKNGKIAFAVFNIVKSPEILPSSQTLAVTNKFKFSVSGGKAPYVFSVKTGGGSITPAGEYTAPNATGAATIEVVDALGGKGQASIAIVDALQFSTPTITMAQNTSETFATVGGVAPVTIALESGLGSFDPTTRVYSASGVAGVATLLARDSLGNEARAQITINNTLLINPPLIELVISSQHTFSASGGVPPYTFSLVSGSGSITAAGVYTAPAAIGTAQIRVTDSKGAISHSFVNINPELSFIFPNISLLVNETKNLSLNVIGGAPPLTYSVSPGAGTINPSTGVFVAGSAPGVYTATVVDSKGYSAQASVTVQPPMAITPVNATLMAGTDLSYSASGGTPPYTFSVATGGGSFAGSVYTAPNTAQSATVRVTDSLGNFVTTNVTVNPILQISPSTVSLLVSGTQAFIAAGGIPPYTFNIVSGAGSIDPTSGVYNAPPAEGTALLEVVDAQSNYAQASITILDQVRIVPSPLSMVKNSSLTVLATGGLGPYKFSIENGVGTIDSDTGLFESANQAGTVTVKATDSLGNFGTGTIIVYDSLTINNAPDEIMVGETITLAASGGEAPYVYSVQSGSSSAAIDSATGVLTATMTPGTAVVRVTDKLNQTYEKTISVRALLTIAPTTLTLAPNNTSQFTASGGVGAYTFSIFSGVGSTSTSGLYTAPGTSGTAVVQVTDAGGRTAQATVTINAILTLTPPLTNLKYSDTQSLSASGGVPPYAFSKISGPGAINVSGGLFTADTTAGTSILRVTDALGNYAEATVITIAPVEITPSSKDLAFSEVFSFTALKGLPPYAFSITAGAGTINASSGSFAAGTAAGVSTVRVTDALGQIASATVNTYESLLISPLSASIATSQSQNLSATGGVLPYTFSLMNGTGSVQTGPDRYVASTTVTTAKVKVTDNVGNFSIGTINVVGPVSISPTTLTLAVNETRSFSGLGGSTPYSFSVLAGGGSINASTGVYTAPATTGSATIRITDALNQTADATVTIIDALSLSPATVTLSVGNTQQFTPSGGVGPFTYDVQSGSGTVNASGLYTAGGSSGSAVVRVTDSEGRTANANVTINGALAISPTTVELIFAGTQTFSASGGVGPYSYTVVVPGAGSVGVSTGAYVAPSVAGTETVRVTDSLGNTANATVTVIGPVQISPTTKSMVVGDTFTFTASGGKTPYSYSVSAGGGSVTSGGVYTASNTVGSYTMRVTDALGQTSDATVTLTPSVTLSPATATIAVNNQQQFTASNGTGPYTYSIQSGSGSINSSGLFTAGGSAGTTVVRVTDSGGRTATSTVTVNGALAISPTTQDLIFAGTQTFSATGGVGPYSYTVVVPGAGSVGVSTGAYVAPSVAGTESIRVTDSLGNTSDAVVTIFGPVQISPTTKTMAVGEVFTFSASGGKSPYTYGVSAGGGAITNAGVYTAGSTTGSYTVRVTDALGQYSDSVVTLTPAIDLAPDTNSIRIGQTQVLTRTGGTAPFTYTVVSGGGTFNDGTMTYTPPTTPTTATVRVTDNVGNTDQVTITVSAGVPAALAFVTSAQTVPAGVCSGSATVKLQDAYSNDTTATASTTVNFAAANLTFYSDASCTSVVTSRVIATGDSQASVYFKGTVSGLQIATVSSAGLSSVTQTESITGAAETSLAMSPNTLSVVAGDCSAVSQLRVLDSYGNPTVPASVRSVTVAGSGVTYFSDVTCATTLTMPVTLNSGTPTQNIYFKKTVIGATTVTASASGLSDGTLTLNVSPASASKLAYITQPPGSAGSGAVLTTQPVVGVYDQYNNFVATATNSVTLSLSSSNTCSNSVGGLSATTNPVSAVSGQATFAGTKISSTGDFYIKAEASGLTLACSAMVSVTTDYSQTLANLPGYIPHDNLAEATMLIVPKIGADELGPAKVIEVTTSGSAVTVTCNGSACAACQTPSATCFKAHDHGQGAYSVQVKSNTAGTANFAVRYYDGVGLSDIATLSTIFNTANFTTISANTTITSAHAGLNLYFTGGTATFDATATDKTFGVLFVRGGTLTHTATTATTAYKMDLNTSALVLQSGSINATNTGYTTGKSWSASGAPSADVYNPYSNHGGMGKVIGGAAYGDYRDPQFPGSGGFTASGGGVIRINSSGACVINGSAQILANSGGIAGFNYGAGGSIKLQCAGLTGTAASQALQSMGGSAGGGGGRIALISTGSEASFAGSFAWPKDATKMTNFVDRVRVTGASYSGSTSGAGTVFVKHSGLQYGGLIVNNNGIYGGTTSLPGLTKIAGTASGQNLPFTVALPTGYSDLYKGMRLRPDITVTNGTPNNLLDDNIVTITSNNLSSVTVSGSLAGVAPGATLRTLEILDYISVGGGGVLTSESDVVVLSGNFVSDKLNLTNGLIEIKSGALIYPEFEDITLSAGSYTLTDFKPVKNLIISGGTLTYTQPLVIRNDFTVSSGSATLSQVSIARNLNMSGGTLSHIATAAGTTQRLELTIGDSFNLTGGTIDLTMKGYPATYSYGSAGASTTLGVASNGLGASHGGRGYGVSGSVSPTYGDYKDPNFPGAASNGSNPGGGVLRLVATNLCTINSGGKIDASGNFASAGGSIKMVCGGFAGTAGAASVIANGVGANSTYPSGGGGRIALISTGNEASFTGNFAWPNDSTKMTNFLSRVQARGGNLANYVAGAGTIYLKHSGQTYGSLIISNGGTTGGHTDLPWFSATTGTASGQNLPISPSLATGYIDLYKGRMLRTDLSQDGGTPNDLTDDNRVTVASHSLSSLTVTGSLAGVASGATLRTIEILDNLSVGEGANLRTGSDIVVLGGSIQSSPVLGFNNGSYEMTGTAKIYPTVQLLTFSSGTFTGTNLSGNDITVSGATLNYTGTLTAAGVLTVSSGSLTVPTTQAASLVLSGGTYNVTTSTTTTGNVTISGAGTNTTPTLNVGNDLLISGGTNAFASSNVTRDLVVSGGTSTLDAGTVGRDFKISAGTIKHRATTTSNVYRMEFTSGGVFQMTGGSINVTGLGYTAYPGGSGGYSYSFGSLGPSTALGSIVNGNNQYAGGGSHGGRGGWVTFASGITYGDYRNPYYPGGGGAPGGTGGGVVNITASGACTIDSGATIIADGVATAGGAGGSVKLSCASIGGTAGSAAVRANGGSGSFYQGGGGGGRIALISSGNAASFSGSFALPTSAGTMTSFLNVTQAYGGTQASGVAYRGGAGTIYVKHSGLTYGGLIISNNNLSGHPTLLPSLSATTGTVSGSNLPFTSSLPTGYTDLYKDLRFRPDVSLDNGTPSNLLDDNIVSMASHSLSNIVATGSLVGVSSGKTLRSIEILDSLYVGGTAILTTGSDLVVQSGNFISGNLETAEGVISITGGAASYPNTNSTALSSGTYAGTDLNTNTLTVNGATVTFSGSVVANSMTLSSGSYSAGATTVNTDMTVTGGTNTSATLNVGNDLLVSGGTNAFASNTVNRDFIVSGGTNTLDTGSVGRDFRISSGTLKHRTTTTTTVYKFNYAVAGLFRMTGGSINVTGLGYPAASATGKSYSFSSTGPTTDLGSTINGNPAYAGGGSHGGRGAAAASPSGATYGDYRSPIYPGGGGAIGGSGGGVVILDVTGSCTIDTGATVVADGTAGLGGAGGSIKMSCASFAGTAGSAAVRANGGTGDNANRGAGGGGRIALISSGNETSFGGNFSIPNSSAAMTSFTGVVQAFGGNSTPGATYRGGAGTIYLKHSNQLYGNLIINNNVTGSATDMLSSVANTSTINAKVDSTNLKVTSAATPFTGMVDLFVGSIVHVWPTSGGNVDPLSGTHTSFVVTSNTTNNFISSAAPFASLTIANDHQYRFTHTLDALYVGGGATMNMASSDLILVGGAGYACDLVSSGSNFTVSAGSSITNGNSYSSVNCPDTNFATKGTTINFARYCNGSGTCL